MDKAILAAVIGTTMSAGILYVANQARKREQVAIYVVQWVDEAYRLLTVMRLYLEKLYAEGQAKVSEEGYREAQTRVRVILLMDELPVRVGLAYRFQEPIDLVQKLVSAMRELQERLSRIGPGNSAVGLQEARSFVDESLDPLKRHATQYFLERAGVWAIPQDLGKRIDELPYGGDGS